MRSYDKLCGYKTALKKCNSRVTRVTAAKYKKPRSFRQRNTLLPFQRSELALKMKQTIRAKAKANQKLAEGGDRKKDFVQGLQKSEKVDLPVHTDDELSKLAGVSRFTIRQA